MILFKYPFIIFQCEADRIKCYIFCHNRLTGTERIGHTIEKGVNNQKCDEQNHKIKNYPACCPFIFYFFHIMSRLSKTRRIPVSSGLFYLL